MTSRPRTLTVATYNLYLGADLALLFGVTSTDELATQVAVVRERLERTDFTQRAGAVARILAREQADVVGLQEVSRWATAPARCVKSVRSSCSRTTATWVASSSVEVTPNSSARSAPR